jgi:hypothetical protein
MECFSFFFTKLSCCKLSKDTLFPAISFNKVEWSGKLVMEMMLFFAIASISVAYWILKMLWLGGSWILLPTFCSCLHYFIPVFHLRLRLVLHAGLKLHFYSRLLDFLCCWPKSQARICLERSEIQMVESHLQTVVLYIWGVWFTIKQNPAAQFLKLIFTFRNNAWR